MLRPDVSKPLQYAWGTFVIALLAAVGLVSWISNDDGLGRRLTAAANAQQKREDNSTVLLKEEVDGQRQANHELSETIERIKGQVGIAPIEPFIVPDDYTKQRDFYLKLIFEATRNTLYERAVRRRISNYEPELGYSKFDFTDDEVRQELTRLQLIAKAVMLALSTEGNLDSIEVEHGEIVQTGPQNRPPLLVEYAFSLKVKGALTDVLWLLHQLGVEQPEEEIERGLNTLFTTVQRLTGVTVQPLDKEDSFPLIVRGLEINSSNVSARDSIAMLEVTIELAGMEFLSADERAKGGREMKGTRSDGARLPGRAGSRGTGGRVRTGR